MRDDQGDRNKGRRWRRTRGSHRNVHERRRMFAGLSQILASCFAATVNSTVLTPGGGFLPRVLGRYVREQRVLPSETAIRKMTLMSAEQLSLKDRGRIAQGYIADLVLFDPSTVRNQALRQPWPSAGRSRQPFLFEPLNGHPRKNGCCWRR